MKAEKVTIFYITKIETFLDKGLMPLLKSLAEENFVACTLCVKKTGNLFLVDFRVYKVLNGDFKIREISYVKKTENSFLEDFKIYRSLVIKDTIKRPFYVQKADNVLIASLENFKNTGEVSKI